MRQGLFCSLSSLAAYCVEVRREKKVSQTLDAIEGEAAVNRRQACGAGQYALAFGLAIVGYAPIVMVWAARKRKEKARWPGQGPPGHAMLERQKIQPIDIGGAFRARPLQELKMKSNIASCTLVVAALSGCAQPDGSLAQPNFQQAFQAFGDALNKPASSPGPGAAQARPSGSRQGKMVSINAVNIMIEEPRPTDPRWTGKRIQETPLAGLFARHPITRPGDYWPRVSVRIVDYSETLVSDASLRYQTQMPGSPTPNIPRPPECIKFDAVVWSSEKKSQKVGGVVLCNGDLQSDGNRLTMGAMRNYRTLMAPISISSEQLRTAGPRVPSQLIPFDTQEARAMYGNGGYLFGELFVAMGYRGPLDGDQRLWFVNLANK